MDVRVDCSPYVAEVLKFRRALNLTSVADADLFVQRFINPSLALAASMPAAGRLLDIGSGMGVPGIPLLMALPGLQGVLVERRKKRTEFLRHVIRTLSLNAVAYDADIRALEPLRVDVCVARAVTDEGGLLRMCAPHMVAGGRAVLPVPRESKAVVLNGWELQEEKRVASGVEAGDEQLIRCYRYA
ncbi:MAG: RsmG family class I SAM-dependent methyltransferase [Mariprofundaceae bacterium]